jgi:hypothetical protein
MDSRSLQATCSSSRSDSLQPGSTLHAKSSRRFPICLTLAVPIDGCKIKDKPEGEDEILTDESPLGVYFRLYLQPTTSIGAAFPEVVYDKIIKFTPVPGTD